MERSLALIGQTADSGRVRDIAGAFVVLWATAEKQGKAKQTVVRLAASWQAGVIAAYAALFVPGAIDELVILDPPISHRFGPHFLNVLRVLDIPEALGCLAPRKLTLVNAKDPAFDRTVEIYRRAGAADKIERR